MSFTEFGQSQIKSLVLAKLSMQAEKVLKANTDVLICGAAGSGKTTWAKRLAVRKGQSFYKIFEGRDFAFDEFNENIQIHNPAVVIIEDIDQLTFSDQSKLLFWLDNPSRKTKAFMTTRTALWDLVEKQQFRSDLYFRISVACIKLPQIIEMKECLPDFTRHLIGVYQILHNKQNLTLGNEALAKICDWSWPGNFSELENVLEKAILLTEGREIQPDDIETEGRVSSGSTLPIKKLAEVERDLILQTLKVTDQNRTRAAEILGISIRTLRNKIQEYREEGIL